MANSTNWINQQVVNNFLNPPRNGMGSGEYAALRSRRAKEWNAFLQNNKTTGIR